MSAAMTRSKIAILAFAAVLYIAVLALSAKHQFGGNLSGFLFASPVGNCPEVHYDGLIVRDDSGYDGQFFYYIAIDPFVRSPSLYSCTRTDAYRYQRILFPMLASAVSAGNKERLPIAMLAVNLAGILLGTYFFIRICEASGLHPGLALFFTFSTGCLISLTRNTCEPLYIAALIGAFYFYAVRRDLFLTAAALCLGTFAKELALGTAGILLMFEWIKRRNFKTSLWLLMPFGFYFLWQMRIDSLFAELPVQVTHAHPGAIQRSIVNFFAYYAERFAAVRAGSVQSWVDPLLQTNLILCLAFYAREALKMESPYPWIGGLFGLLVLAFSFPPNGTDFWGYGRHSAEIFLCALMIYIVTKQKRYLIPLAANGLTFLLIAIVLT